MKTFLNYISLILLIIFISIGSFFLTKIMAKQAGEEFIEALEEFANECYEENGTLDNCFFITVNHNPTSP